MTTPSHPSPGGASSGSGHEPAYSTSPPNLRTTGCAANEYCTYLSRPPSASRRSWTITNGRLSSPSRNRCKSPLSGSIAMATSHVRRHCVLQRGGSPASRPRTLPRRRQLRAELIERRREEVHRLPHTRHVADLAVDAHPHLPPRPRGGGVEEPETFRVTDQARQAADADAGLDHPRERQAAVHPRDDPRFARDRFEPPGLRRAAGHPGQLDDRVPCAATAEVRRAASLEILARRKQGEGDDGDFALEDGLLFEAGRPQR